MKKLTIVALLTAITTQTSYALTIPEGIVPPTAITSGSGAGYLAQDIAREGGYKSTGRTIIGTIAGATTAFIAGKLLSRYTAKGKYKRAKHVAERVAGDELISTSFPTPELTRTYVRKIYFGSNWPLVEAHEHLVYTMHELANAQRLARDAREHAGKKVGFRRDCEKLLMMIAASIELVGKRTDEIIADGQEYDRQYRRFQEWRKIRLQEQSVSLQNYALIQDQFNHWDEVAKDESQHSELLNLIKLLKP